MYKLVSILICGAAAVLTPMAGEAADSVDTQVRQLALEVKALRLELYRVTLRQISAEAAPWQRELQSVQSRIVRLEAEEQVTRDRLRVLQQQFAEDRLSPEERREVQQMEIAGGKQGSDAIAAEREQLRRREAEIARYLQLQTQAWNAASSAVTKLETELQPPPPGVLPNQ